MKKEFLLEIAMMKRVSTGKNPYVVNMIGCCSVQEPLALVLELVPNGNLLEYLKANRTIVSTRVNCIVFVEKVFQFRFIIFVPEQDHIFTPSLLNKVVN